MVPTESPLCIPERPLNDLHQGILRERLQDDDQRSGEQRADHFEGGILRGGADEDHRADSTWGRKASCWALLKRWVSSTNRILRWPLTIRGWSAAVINRRRPGRPVGTAEQGA